MYSEKKTKTVAIFLRARHGILRQNDPPCNLSLQVECLTGSTAAAGDVGALAARLATRHLDARPLPVRAGSRSAEDVDVGGRGRDGTGDLGHGEARDGHAGRGGAGGAAVLVVLLDHDTVLGDTAEGDSGVGHAGHGASGAVNGLDAHAVLRVANLGVGDGHRLDGVVLAAADGADGQAVATNAGAASEGDVCTGVDGKAVILVLDVCA